ncbi:MAG: pyrroline-5-carboxylate reductase [Clostridiales bacterium]|jgi:pyrroline-5-carboxylate reductase|nr:pyrroline-5-carboxylate reductase [Clostridiales bacterium]
MNKKIGFIGSGNMCEVIVGGILKTNFAKQKNILISGKNKNKLEKIKSKYNIQIFNDNCEIAKKSDVLFLTIKPQNYKEAVLEIKNFLKEKIILVSVAPGIKISFFKNLLSKNVKIVRSMPNTPALVEEGITGICLCESITNNESEFITEIFKSFGKIKIISENIMDAITALSGSSPAFLFIIIEAMADGAVLCGMPRDLAYKFAAQTVLGSAKMVLTTKKHPGELKDMVCSPNGTTIEGVAKLEQLGIRNCVIEAIKSAFDKSKKISEAFDFKTNI